MASTKIQNLPLKAPIGAMKIPTGGFGDYSITVSSIGDFIIDAFNLATKDYVDNLLIEKEDRIDTTGGFLTPVSQNSSVPDTTNDVIDEVAQALLDRIEYVKDNFSAAPSHNELTGRSATGAHPSTSISHKSGTVYTYLSNAESDINTINNVTIPTINQSISLKQDQISTTGTLTGISEETGVNSVSHAGLNAALQALLNRITFNKNHNNLLNRSDENSHPSSAISYSTSNQEKVNDGLESIDQLTSISNPKNGMRIYVKSYYTGLNTGGGWFVYNSSRASENDKGLVINGWVRQLEDGIISIEYFGAHPTKDFLTNSTAINAALANSGRIYFPENKTYQIDFDIINVQSNTHIFGGSILQGQQSQVTGADGRGVFLKIQGKQNIVVEGITIKNGYRGRGIECTNSQFIYFKNVKLDGFTYCMWVGEQRLSDTVVQGCQYVWIENCSFLSARYWNLYIRGASITDDEVKTKKVWVINPYVYNASMAGIVLAEGHVSQVVIENPVFKRCNLCIHLELATDVTVINPRDEDTGKKPDHQPPNTEYPYEGWGIYTAFAHRIKIKGGQLTTTCYHFATTEQPSTFVEYEGFTGFDFVYEAGSTPDSAKNIFQNYTFNNVTATSRLIWQNPGANHYLRDFTYQGCRVISETSRNAMNAPRTVNLKVIDCYMVNAYVTIGNEGYSQFMGNTVTNNAASVNTFNGTDLTAIFDFKDNTFINTVTNLGDRVFTIQNFGVVNYDNTLNSNAQYSAVITNVAQLTWGLGPHLQLRSTTPYSTTNVTNIINARRPLEVASWTSANLSSATSGVNTTSKYFGKEVYNSTTAKFMKSLGSTPTSGWVQIDDNSVVITPA